MPDSQTVQSQLKQVAALLKNNQFKEAQMLLQSLIKEYPDNADVWYMASHASKDPEQQKKAVQRALRLNPNHAQAQARLAKLARQTTSNASAVKTTQQSKAKISPAKPARKSASSTQSLSRYYRLAVLVIIVAGGISLVLVAMRLRTPEFTVSENALFRGEYIAYFDGNELFLVKPDGTGQASIYKNRRLTRLGQWSPDGTLFTLYSFDSNLLSFDSAGDRRFSLGQGSHVSLSPDAHQAVVDTAVRGWKGRVAVVNVDGSEYTPIEEDGISPEWSPRGDRIAFITYEGSTSTIYTIRPDGSDKTRVTEGTNPKWSPDGQRILFTGKSAASDTALYRINADGSWEEEVAPAIQYSPYYSWSPDGRKIAYMSSKESDYYLNVTSDNGSELLWQYNFAYGDDIPQFVFSPDSQKFLILHKDAFIVVDINTHLTKTFTVQRAEPPEGFINELVGLAWLTERQVAGLDKSLAKSRAAAEKAIPPQPYYFVENINPVRLYRFDGSGGALLQSPVPGETLENDYLSNYGFPAWSPDGTQLAYRESSLYLMNIDGSNRRELESRGFRPRWSPDGKYISYVTHEYDGNRAADDEGFLYVVKAEGGDSLLIGDQPVSDWAWSPDSQQIAVAYEQTLTVVSADGTNARVIAEKGKQPYWSPDGQSIVFSGDRECICIVPANGAQPPAKIADGHSPAWSPDGTRIVFMKDGFSIATINVDGRDLRVLTRSDSVQYMPVWSPDGLYIAYWENRDAEIFPRSSRLLRLMTADGRQTAFIPVPRFGETEYRMEWSPAAVQPQLDTFMVVQDEMPAAVPAAGTPG